MGTTTTMTKTKATGGWDEAQAQTTCIVVWAPGEFLLCSFLFLFFVIQLTSTFLSTGLISQRHDTNHRTKQAGFLSVQFFFLSTNLGLHLL